MYSLDNDILEASKALWFVVEGDDGKMHVLHRNKLEMGMTVHFSSASRVSALTWLYENEDTDLNV